MRKSTKLAVFVPYSIKPMDAAPTVRAYNMYNALSRKIKTYLISGQSALRAWYELHFMATRKKVDYVYVEALASTLNPLDYIFLEKLHSKGTLIFPFIRDLYWKYPCTLENEDAVKSWFDSCEREMNWYLRNATGLLFPTSRMAQTINFPYKYALPPAGDASRCFRLELPKKRNIVFVGAVTARCGAGLLFEAMECVVNEYKDARCVIVGKAKKDLYDKWRSKPWLKMIHGNYYSMPTIMFGAYIAVIPLNTSLEHNNFALPLRLFDYMSFGRPVVATNCEAMASFITSNQVGIVTEGHPESLARGILKLLDDPELAMKLGRNGYKAVRLKHSWDHRASALIGIMDQFSSRVQC